MNNISNIDDFFNNGYTIDQEDYNNQEESSDMDEDYQPQDRYPLRSRGYEKSEKSKKRLPKFQEPETNSLYNTSKKFNAFTPFLKCLNQNKTVTVGREVEAKQIMAMVEGGIRPLLLGLPGIGKESTVIKVAELYKHESVPKNWRGKNIYCINCQDLIAGNIDEQHAEGIVEELQEVVEKYFSPQRKESILYFKDIGSLMIMPKVVDFMQMLFKRPFPFIASMGAEISDDEIKSVTKKLITHNFSVLQIKESPLKDINEIVYHHLHKSSDLEQIRYKREAVELAVRLSDQYIKARPLPIKAINIIQEASYELLIHSQFSGKRNSIEIGSSEVAKFVSSKTNIPFEDLLEDSIFNEKRLISKLKKNIIGQDYAIQIVAERASIWKMGLLDSRKPWGVFLFVGPTGVGKTELAKQLAKELFHNEEALIILDGSEYKESHTVSNLVGAPRGYEGHDLGGMLTDPLLENPYRVVLFDEFEKAHDEVRKLFLQAFDRGSLTDRRGKKVDCSKTLFLLTSNLGSSEFFKLTKDISHDDLVQSLKPTLVKELSIEMCGRFHAIVPFMPIEKKHLLQLAEVELQKISHHLMTQNGIELQWRAKLIDRLVSMDVDLRLGGRLFCQTVNAVVTGAIKNAMILHQKRLQGKLLLDISARGELTVTV